MSNAEKQRKYRERLNGDPERRSKYLQKKREKYEEDKKNGKRLLINELSARDQRVKRKQWREQQKSHRLKEKAKKAQLTPPVSPVSPHDNSSR